MKSIYEISVALRAVFLEAEENEGVLTEEQIEQLKISSTELETKGAHCILYALELDSYCENIDAQIARLEKLKKAPKQLSKRLKDNVKSAMLEFGVEKIESEILTLSFRKSEQTIIDNEAELPVECIKTETVKTVDKAAVKALIKAGQIVGGAHIETVKNLQIK